ncbi:MAG: type III polyketide synthase [Planctomycetes bacterium]|nr:type III polyketide synthase [Planctomycetota bacterium]
MTTITSPSGFALGRAAAEPSVHLIGLGAATPEVSWPQPVIADALASAWNLQGADLERWHRISAGTSIERRHSVMPLEEVLGLSTRMRMEAYERCSGPLAARAAAEALRRGGVAAEEVTELIVVSCTGFSAPGLDVALVESLGLRPTVRRTLIGFMGCFGAVSGLRTAVGACSADRRAVALVVCLELCSLHLRADRSVQSQVAGALFADGAAAAVLTAGLRGGGAARGSLGRVTLGGSLLLLEGRDWMTWRITDTGFAMTLTRDVPPAIRRHLGAFVATKTSRRPACFVVHPGGPGILDAVDEALGLEGERGIEVAWEVLRQYGNMSSATLLFVLAETIRRGHRRPALLLAFGPGLTIESLTVLAAPE